MLEIGAGSGRNTRALLAAGFRVVNPGAAERCSGALSTHALLHGTPASLARELDAIAASLEPGAPLYATFGSIHDARYGEGAEHEPYVYAPTAGDEIGVAHVYFDRARLEALVSPRFTIESLDEVDVDAIAGRWAHQTAPLRGAVHWFALLRQGRSPGVRAVAPDDSDAWLHMRSALWPDARREELAEEIRAYVSAEHPAERAFLYEDAGGRLCGMLELSLRPFAEGCSGSPVPYIEGWFVEPAARRRGAGTALVRHAEQWAIAHGFDEIASDALVHDAASLRAHEALGFIEAERTVNLRKRLVARE